MRHIISVICILILTPGIARLQSPDIPQTIAHQGILTSNDGTPVDDGLYSFTVGIYDSESASDALWTETQNISVINGIYNLLLGIVEPLDLDFDTQYWIGMSVDGGEELNPRISLSTVPYAFHAHTVSNGSITSPKLADESVTQEKIHPDVTLSVTGEAGGDLTGVYPNPGIADGAVTASKLSAAAITSDKIADAAVTLEKIHPDVTLPISGEAGGDLNGNYPEPEIADGAVSTSKIAEEAVTDAKISDVSASKITGALLTNQIADGAVTADKLSDSYILLGGVSNATDGIAVTGILNEGSIPVEGAGVRLMWYPRKMAFRAGRVTGTLWNDTNVGPLSTAFGYNTTASGEGSNAMGLSTTARGAASTAMGVETIARGFTSLAMGQGTQALANHMLAIGRYNSPTGVAGSNASDRPAFVVGNGINDSNRSHALLLLANGDLRITGPMRVGSYPSSTGTGVCRTTNGTLANCSSSARYKEEVRRLDLQASAELVSEMRPVTFRWKETGLEDLGLIAEELAGIEPRLVIYDAAGEIEGIKYNHLSALLVAAVQDLQTRCAETMTARQEQITVHAPRNSSNGHTEPMAQDIYAAFGLGDDNPRIKTNKADGIAIAEIQDLNEKLKIKIQQFEKKLITQKRIIIELENRLSKIEAMNE